jgi:hypothetical protein
MEYTWYIPTVYLVGVPDGHDDCPQNQVSDVYRLGPSENKSSVQVQRYRDTLRHSSKISRLEQFCCLVTGQVIHHDIKLEQIFGLGPGAPP